MKIGPDTLSFTAEDIRVATSALALHAAEDPVSERVLKYLCGVFASTNAAHALRHEYLHGEAIDLSEVEAKLQAAGSEAYVALKDDFMIGALQRAIEHMTWISAETGDEMPEGSGRFEKLNRTARGMLVSLLEGDEPLTTKDLDV